MDPKLKQARDEIESILKKHDIAGHAILHNTPGQIEVFFNINPSYSKLVLEDKTMRLRSKLEDYGGDVVAQVRDLAATANMVQSMGEALGFNGVFFLEIADMVNKTLGAEHTEIERDDQQH